MIAAQIEQKMLGKRADWQSADVEIARRTSSAELKIDPVSWLVTWSGSPPRWRKAAAISTCPRRRWSGWSVPRYGWPTTRT